MAVKTNEVILSRKIWLGPKSAPVSVVEFGDYESGACARAHEIVKALLKDFEGQVRFNFRHFPMSQVNQYAMKAAEAAVAAAQYGKFWEMHDKLFENRKQLGTISLKSYAREIGIADKKFLVQLMDSVYSWQVRDDLVEGLAKGVRDIPAFFINGEKYEGELDYDEMRKQIQALISDLL